MKEIKEQAVSIFGSLNRGQITVAVAERWVLQLLDQAHSTGVNDAIDQMRKDAADRKARNGGT